MLTTVLIIVTSAVLYGQPLEWNNRTLDVSGASSKTSTSKADGDGAAIFEFKTASPWPYFSLTPLHGESWDLSRFKNISFDVENLNSGAQAEIWFDADGKRLGNIVVSPNEKRTVMFKLNHEGSQTFDPLFSAKRMPDGFKGGLNVDTSAITRFRIMSPYPLYARYRISNIRLSGTYDQKPETLTPESFFPFIDHYGQYIHDDWPEKIRNNQDLKSSYRKESSELKPRIASWNKWGGYANGPRLKATGFFRTEKYKGKWFLVDPDGRLFFSRGVNAINRTDWIGGKGKEKCFLSKSRRGDRGFTFYGDNIDLRYENAPVDFFNFQCLRLESWGFNTIGNWSDNKLYQLKKLPYTMNLPLPKCPRLKGDKKAFVDVFSPEFSDGMQNPYGNDLRWAINDPWCIGVFIGNELRFGKSTEIAEDTFESSASQPAKQKFIRHLRKKYSSISALNQVWGSTYSDWNHLLDSNTLPDKKKSHADFASFTSMFAEQFFRICREGIKRHSPNTLYLGSRLFCGEDYFREYLNQAAAKYCDVVAYNLYMFSYDRLKPRGMPDVPIMITESTVGQTARGRFGTLSDSGLGHNARTESLTRQLESAFRHPQVVGIHHFSFKDQPLTGRWDGENYCFGLVDICDTPYQNFLDANRAMSQELYEFRLKSQARDFSK